MSLVNHISTDISILSCSFLGLVKVTALNSSDGQISNNNTYMLHHWSKFARTCCTIGVSSHLGITHVLKYYM